MSLFDTFVTIVIYRKKAEVCSFRKVKVSSSCNLFHLFVVSYITLDSLNVSFREGTIIS